MRTMEKVFDFYSNLSRKKFARYGPPDRYEASPKAGMCLSVFALIRSARHKGVLFGLPKPNKQWLSDWMPSWHYYSTEELSKIYDEWRLPSSYLLEGEHPVSAIKRIVEGQLGIRRYEMSGSPMVFSYTSPSSWYRGNKHWDLALVYSLSINDRKSNDSTIDSRITRSL